MQSEFANDSSKQYETVWTDHQSSQSTYIDQTLQKKLDLKLYWHFERFLTKQDIDGQCIYEGCDLKLSKQQNVIEVIKCLDNFRQKIKPLPPQHIQQLIFLIDIFDNSNYLITDNYYINEGDINQTNPPNFYLSFRKMKQKINLKQFSCFNNWNHLVKLSFLQYGYFNDDDWKVFMQHVDNFSSLKMLILNGNKITVIRGGDIEKFKSLQLIDLQWNPLRRQSKELLKRLKQKNSKITISIIDYDLDRIVKND